MIAPSRLVIELQVDAAVVDDDAGALAEGEPHLHLDAEVLLPERLAVQVVDEKSARAEEGVDPLAVGGRRVRREAAIQVVVSLVRRRGCGRALPEDLAGGAIDGEHFEAMFLAGATAASAGRRRTACRRRGGLGLLPGRNRRRQEEPVAPGDGRRVAASGDLDLPLHVRGVAPGDRRLTGGGTGVRRRRASAAMSRRQVSARRSRRRSKAKGGDPGANVCISACRNSGTLLVTSAPAA